MSYDLDDADSVADVAEAGAADDEEEEEEEEDAATVFDDDAVTGFIFLASHSIPSRMPSPVVAMVRCM